MAWNKINLLQSKNNQDIQSIHTTNGTTLNEYQWPILPKKPIQT